MRLAELRAARRFEVIDVPVPEPGPDEVLVRVANCGVCASELSTWSGHAPIDLPARIGHEVSGTVAACGSAVRGFAVDDAVAVWTTGSGYADYVAVPAAYCRAVSAVPLEQALAEPIACAVNAVELARVRLADDVVVIGAGFMGLLVPQLALLRGARQVLVADPRPDARELALRLGASRAVEPGALPAAVRESTGDVGADVTFEVTGVQAGLDAVGDVTRMSGTVGLVGFHQGEPRQIPLAQWNWLAFTIANGHVRDAHTIMTGFSTGMRLLESHQLQMAPLMTHRFDLEQINDAFATAVDKPAGFVKATVVM